MKKILIVILLAVTTFGCYKLVTKKSNQEAEIENLLNRFFNHSKMIDNMRVATKLSLEQRLNLNQKSPAEIEIFKVYIDSIDQYINSQEFLDIFKNQYKQHLSIDDLKAMVKFTESAASKRITEATPTILNQVTLELAKKAHEFEQKMLTDLMTLKNANITN